MANGGAPMGPGEGNVYLGGGQWGPKGSYDPTNPTANFGAFKSDPNYQAANGGTWGGDYNPIQLFNDANAGTSFSMPNFGADWGTAQLTPLTKQIRDSHFSSTPPGGGTWGTNPQGPTGGIGGGAGSNDPFNTKAFWSLLGGELDASKAGFDQVNSGLNLKNALKQMGNADSAGTLKDLYAGDVKKADVTGMGAARDRIYGQALRDVAKQRYGSQTAGAKAEYQGITQKISSDAAAASGGYHQGSSDEQNVAAQGLVKNLVGAQADEHELDARGVRYMQMADELAAKNGVDRQQLLIKLNDGLRQLGLDDSVNAADLFIAQGSNDAQKSAAAQAIINNLTGEAQSGVFGTGYHNPAAPAGHASSSAGYAHHGRFS